MSPSGELPMMGLLILAERSSELNQAKQVDLLRLYLVVLPSLPRGFARLPKSLQAALVS